MLVECVHSKCSIKFLNGVFSLFWTPMSTIFFFGLPCFYMPNMFWLLVVCFTHFVPWVLCHALLMHLTCTPQAHFMHTLYRLTCFTFYSCYVSLVRPLALKTWFCDLICLSNCYLGLFCSFLWTNLNLIKFVSMLVFVVVCLCWCSFCRCLLVRNQ